MANQLPDWDIVRQDAQAHLHECTECRGVWTKLDLIAAFRLIPALAVEPHERARQIIDGIHRQRLELAQAS